MEIQPSNWGTKDTFKYEIRRERYRFPLHIHQFAELVLMLDGVMDVTVNGKKETARSGQFILIYPFQAHSYYSEQVNHFVIYTFSPRLISDFTKNTEGKVGESAVFNASTQSRQMFTECVTREGEYTDTSLYTVLSCIYSMLADYTQQVKMIKDAADTNVLSKVIRYLNDHYSEQVALSALAHSIGYSTNYLSHCIHTSLGLNYCRLLACIRVENAKSLLTETKKSILEIALESGFGSERSFHRQFRSITGLTPGNYRASRQLKVAMHRDFRPESTYILSLDDMKERPTVSDI